jgi:hypothetical protein
MARVAFALVLCLGLTAAGFAEVPRSPVNLVSTVSGNTVTLTWQAAGAGGVPSSYLVEAAVSPGGSVVASLPTSTTSLVVPNVPNGIYYVRVRGQNVDGLSAPSNEVVVVVPGGVGTCTSPPNAPASLAATVAGNLVFLSWSAPSGGCPATSYAVHAGSAPGQSNVTVANVGASTTLSSSAPNGTYYVRVIALNSFGGSRASNEVAFTVGTPSVAPPPPQTTTSGQFAVSTTAQYGWSSIDVTVNGRTIGTLSRYYEPGSPASCLAVPGARVVATVPAGAVTYSARSNTGATWAGTATVAPGGCFEIQLTCTNRDCSSPAPPPPTTTTTYHVWGGPGQTQYLGFFTCTFCQEFGSNSINNLFGTYGSRFSSTSIRNGFSQYGSPFSSYSACNEFASSPPRVYNSNRTVFYGELTVNTFRTNAVGAWVNWLLYDVCE